MRGRRLVIAVIVTVCVCAPIAEVLDQWDRTLQDGNDTEANVVVVALCFGAALSVAGIIVARIRAMSSSRSEGRLFNSAPVRFIALSFKSPIPTSSPPTPLRV